MARHILGLLLSAALFSAISPAQTTGNIAGTIRDRSGAILPGVQVSAKRVETGVVRNATTGDDGRFLFPAVPAGTYELRAERATFRPVLQSGVLLTVGETAVLDLTMDLGPVDQQITVTGGPAIVNTTSSELSYLVGEQAIRELPLNGRNYTDLALLQPGVISYPHRDGGSVVAHGVGMSINGQDPRSNVYLLDGTPQNDFTNGPAGSAAGTTLGTETIKEFRVETNAYSAEFGRNSGGQINVISKSGTNLLHGSLYHFHRNDNFDARNFFDPERKPEFKRNQYGVSLGGPIKVDKSFFFVGHEGLRERLGRSILTLVPDENARQGIVNGVNIGVNSAVRPYLEEMPRANGGLRPGGLAEFTFGFKQELTQDFGQGRFDHYFNSMHQIFGRYTYDGARQYLPTDFPQFPRSFLSRNQFATVELRQVLSAETLNTIRLGFSRTRIGQEVEANTTIPLQPFAPGANLVGDIDIGGMPRFGPQSSVTVKLTQNVYGVEDGLVMNRGRHLIKVGGLVERYQDNMVNPTFSLGIYTFGDISGFLRNVPQRFVGLAPGGALDRYWRFTMFGFYVQDDFKIHPRFTLNAGLRYEFATQPIDLYGRDSALKELSDPEPSRGQLYQNPTKKNISPRLGFAWDLTGDGKTSLRSGYGWYFNTNNQQNLIVTVTNPPATPRISIANPTFPNPPFALGVGNTIRPVEWKIKNPNLHVWNINIQRQLPFDTLITAGYAGSRGVHLWRNGDVNIPIPERLPDGTLFFPLNAPRPNRAFGTIELKRSDGNSWYNAGILELRKRFSGGISFQTSYTFSRNLDTTQASTFFSDATNDTTSALPEFPGFNYNKGLADYHAKHNLVVNGIWQIPLGRELRGLAGALAGGWELAGIAQMKSGNPLTTFLQVNRSRSLWAPSSAPGVGFDRPTLRPGRTHESAVVGDPNGYFDPTAFMLPPVGTLGQLGRGTFIGPNLRNVDLAAMKNFKWARLGDAGGAQFRVETFNIFNRANFGTPGLLVFNGAPGSAEQPLGGFGRIRSTVTSSRQIQLGLRIAF